MKLSHVNTNILTLNFKDISLTNEKSYNADIHLLDVWGSYDRHEKEIDIYNVSRIVFEISRKELEPTNYI